MRSNAASTVVVAGHRSGRMVRRDSHWLALVREQDAAEGHAREKYRDGHQNRYAVVWSRRIRSPQLLVQEFPVALVHGDLLYRKCPHKNPEKRPAFPLAVYWLYLKN